MRTARRNWSQFAMADSTGRELTYGRMLAGGVLVADGRARERPSDGEMMGVLLPPSGGGRAGECRRRRWRGACR